MRNGKCFAVLAEPLKLSARSAAIKELIDDDPFCGIPPAPDEAADSALGNGYAMIDFVMKTYVQKFFLTLGILVLPALAPAQFPSRPMAGRSSSPATTSPRVVTQSFPP